MKRLLCVLLAAASYAEEPLPPDPEAGGDPQPVVAPGPTREAGLEHLAELDDRGGLRHDALRALPRRRRAGFEVEPSGEIVWEFANPHVDDRGRRGAIRIARYELDLVDGLRAKFEGR